MHYSYSSVNILIIYYRILYENRCQIVILYSVSARALATHLWVGSGKGPSADRGPPSGNYRSYGVTNTVGDEYESVETEPLTWTVASWSSVLRGRPVTGSTSVGRGTAGTCR